MALNVTRIAISVGAGVVDEALEAWDRKELRTESFKTATDLGRVAMVGLGYALQLLFPRQAALGDALATSCTPLLVKSIARPVRERLFTGQGASSGAGFVPRRRATAGAGVGAGLAASRTYTPGFDEARML